MLAFDFEDCAKAPLKAWFADCVKAVKLPLISGKTILIMHGSKDLKYNIEVIIPRHRDLIIKADYVVCCHGAFMPPWVQRKIPAELVSEKALNINWYSATSITVSVAN